MITDGIDFLRVCIAVLVVYGAVPAACAAAKSSEEALTQGCVKFVRASLYAAVIAHLLSAFGLLLPGGMLAGYLLLSLLFILRSPVLPAVVSFSRLGALAHHVLRIAEDPRRLLRFPQLRSSWVLSCRRAARQERWQSLGLAFLFAVVTVAAATNMAVLDSRFLCADSYHRSLELQMMRADRAHYPVSTTALLAPVAFLSGLDGAAVIRYSNPIFAVILGIVAYATAYRTTKMYWIGWLAAGVTPLAALIPHGEIQFGGIAAIYWISAAAIRTVSRFDTLAAIAIAISIQPMPTVDTLAAVGASGCVVLLSRLLPAWPQRPVICTMMVIVFGLSTWLGRQIPPDGPHQYEAAAKATLQVVRENAQNTWLIISPVQEVALTFGLGWHMELSEFVNAYTIEQVSDPSFRFPFPVQTAFVFVEKAPLLSPETQFSLRAFQQDMDSGIAAYHLRSGRASLQFRAGRLMAAYSRHHRTAVFFEDENLIVFEISQPRIALTLEPAHPSPRDP